MRQGAVGTVRAVVRDGVACVEKRIADPARHRTEVLALGALADSGLPVPAVVEVREGSIVMAALPGTRLDEVEPDARLAGLRTSAELLRALHARAVPPGLPAAADDATIVRRYRAAGGPPLPFVAPPRRPAAFCHGDWADGNLLAADGVITGIVDWEAAHAGDPMRELARAAWGAGRKDRRCVGAIIAGYGADPSEVEAWFPIHAAELWLWFSQAGPPEYLDVLTAQLQAWPGV